MSAKLDIEITPVDRPREAADDLPIVVTATNSSSPVFDGNDLAEGTLVCAVGSNWLQRAEIDTHTIRRADNVVCDSVEACQREAGDFAAAIGERHLRLVAGRRFGRRRRRPGGGAKQSAERHVVQIGRAGD